MAASTLADLVDWTSALNYEKLLRPVYRSQYEVEQAVIGITDGTSGLEVVEISLRSSFTNDFGKN